MCLRIQNIRPRNVRFYTLTVGSAADSVADWAVAWVVAMVVVSVAGSVVALAVDSAAEWVSRWDCIPRHITSIPRRKIQLFSLLLGKDHQTQQIPILQYHR